MERIHRARHGTGRDGARLGGARSDGYAWTFGKAGFSPVLVIVIVLVVVLVAVGVPLGLHQRKVSLRSSLQEDVSSASTAMFTASSAADNDLTKLSFKGGASCGSSTDSDTQCRRYTYDSPGSVSGKIVSPSKHTTLTITVYGGLGYFTIVGVNESLGGYTYTYYSQTGTSKWTPKDPLG